MNGCRDREIDGLIVRSSELRVLSLEFRVRSKEIEDLILNIVD